MLFNSLSFFLFFPLTTALYFLLPHRIRWAFLLLCSCVFYAAFIPAYLLILLAVILIDYVAGLLIERAGGKVRALLLIVSLAANIGFLAIYKYFNFANDNLHALAAFLNWNYSVHNLNMWLPIGLSFHTFQSMAYTIEVYRRRQRAERNLGFYSLYVMFYPQLVAGPIERPQHLLHQFREHHSFDPDRIFDGLKQMLWGFFKKVVIADRLAAVVDAIYANPTRVGGAYLILATWFFAIQIYCDFAGYSDIAIGAARVLGFRLMTNFDRPYVSQSIAEFWRRWHISLSSWFRDYLYIPLGGSRVNLPRWCFNILLVFLISGFWHGANWTFVIWGALHGFYLIFSRFTAKVRGQIAQASGLERLPLLHQGLRMLVTFNLVALAWIFFRSSTITEAWTILRHIPGKNFWAAPAILMQGMGFPAFTDFDLKVDAGLASLLLLAEWVQSQNKEKPTRLARPTWLRWPLYYALVLLILWIGALGGRSFIYFQF